MKIKIDRKTVQKTVADSKARAARRSGAASNWTRPLEGNNIFRIFAFNRGDTGEGAFVREIRVHQPPQGKPIICGRSDARDGTHSKDCAHCDEARRIEQERGRDAASRYRSRPKYAFVVVPLRLGGKVVAGEERRPRVWQASKTVGEKILALVVDEDIVSDPSDFFGCSGLDVKVKFDKSAKGAAMYDVSVLDSSKAKTLDGELQEKAQKCDLFSDLSLEPEWFSVADPAGGDDDASSADADDDGAMSTEGYTEAEQEVFDTFAAKLTEDGLSDEYDLDIAEDEHGDPAPVFYKKADGEDAEGSWEYPEKVKPRKRKAPATPIEEADESEVEARVEAAKAGMSPRASKRRAPPRSDIEENADDE